MKAYQLDRWSVRLCLAGARSSEIKNGTMRKLRLRHEWWLCSNCHEEVFIAEQYSEMGMDVPLSIAQKASEQMNDPDRMRQADKTRRQEAAARARASAEFWGE
jgi:hypothetical protein